MTVAHVQLERAGAPRDASGADNGRALTPDGLLPGARRCMKGRRIIMIGDSLTWQMYNSLACLLYPVTVSGMATTWDKVPLLPLLTMHQPYHHQPWRLKQ